MLSGVLLHEAVRDPAVTDMFDDSGVHILTRVQLLYRKINGNAIGYQRGSLWHRSRGDHDVSIVLRIQ